MKTFLKNLMLFAVLSMFIEGVSSCKGEENYPKKISFMEYSLEGTYCQWKNLEYDYLKPDILIINSNEKLVNYIACTENSYHEIDFSKQTLIVAYGEANNGIHNIEKQLMQIGNNQYKLNVDIKLNYTEVMTKWIAAILVEKLSDKMIVALSTEMTH